MSEGTQVYSVRLPSALVELATLTIRLRGPGRDGKVWSQSDFMRIAMANLIGKMGRSRGRQLRTQADEDVRIYLQRVRANELATLCPEGEENDR